MISLLAALAACGLPGAGRVEAQSIYWTSDGPFGNADVQALAINPTTPTTLYAGTDGGGVFDTLRQVGSACTGNSDCPSGNCVDGICCDPSCTGTCQSCALAVTAQPNGTCAPVGLGLQTSNSCNTGSLACNGSTGPGSCTTLTAQGQACTSNSQCVTGNCVDGICCGSTCSNTCQSCATANTGLVNGTCGSVTAGQQSSNSCNTTGLVCNGAYGAGSCLAATCPANASGAPNCACNSGYTGTLTWNGSSWTGTCVDLCGNGIIDAGEQCDDGNNVSGDGCSSTCQIETGWTCTGQPSACTAPNGQACSSTAQCTSGFCVDGVCCNSACGGGVSNDCQACSVAAGGTSDGTCTPSTGDACNDGNACTQNDVCTSGVCAGTPYTCVPPDQCHQTGTCNGDGTCAYANQPNGNTCSDGNACTTGDTCQGGACRPGAPVVCTASDQCHDVGTCNPSTGTCSNPNKPDGSACNNGDGCPADTCHSGICRPVACPNVDAVVLGPKPVNIVIPPTKTEVDKTLAVTVRNADTTDRTILLQVDATHCPAGSVGAVDFGGGQDSILVPAGKTKKASVPLTIHSADFTSFNFKAPTRCTLVFTASAVVTGGSNDPNPSNNVAVVEVNVVNKHDPEQTVKHETTIKSAAPTTVTIANGAGSAAKTLKAVVGNADYRPTAEKPGDPITLRTSTGCSGVTLSTPVCDPIAGSATATIKGGATKTCKLTATVDPTQISTPNKLSPERCMVTLTAVGPTYPETAPLDPSNTSTELTIDITDRNDF